LDIDDFYPLDLSGYGAGVEDLDLKIGKLAVAFLNAARPDIITENGNFAKSNIDVRLYDLKGPGGLWAGWFDYATSKGGTAQNGTTLPERYKSSHDGRVRVRATPSAPGVARWLSLVFHPVRDGSGQQLQ